VRERRRTRHSLALASQEGGATYGSCPVRRPDRDPIQSSSNRTKWPSLARATVASVPPDNGRGPREHSAGQPGRIPHPATGEGAQTLNEP